MVRHPNLPSWVPTALIALKRSNQSAREGSIDSSKPTVAPIENPAIGRRSGQANLSKPIWNRRDSQAKIGERFDRFGVEGGDLIETASGLRGTCGRELTKC